MPALATICWSPAWKVIAPSFLLQTSGVSRHATAKEPAHETCHPLTFIESAISFVGRLHGIPYTVLVLLVDLG